MFTREKTNHDYIKHTYILVKLFFITFASCKLWQMSLLKAFVKTHLTSVSVSEVRDMEREQLGKQSDKVGADKNYQ